MIMLFVVSTEEPLTKGTKILDRSESFRKLRAIFQGFELGF